MGSPAANRLCETNVYMKFDVFVLSQFGFNWLRRAYLSLPSLESWHKNVITFSSHRYLHICPIEFSPIFHTIELQHSASVKNNVCKPESHVLYIICSWVGFFKVLNLAKMALLFMSLMNWAEEWVFHKSFIMFVFVPTRDLILYLFMIFFKTQRVS